MTADPRQSLFLIALLLACFPAGAADPPDIFDEDPALIQPVSVRDLGFLERLWTRQDGLPNQAIRDMCQTRDGYLWLATDAGLVGFDGRTFVTFDRSTDTNFLNTACTALAESPDGSLWVGTQNGLLNLRPEGTKRYTTADGLLSDRITTLHCSLNGDVWIGTELHVNRLSQGTMSSHLAEIPKAGPDNPRNFCFHEDYLGRTWIGSLDRIKHWDLLRGIVERGSPPEVAGHIAEYAGVLACSIGLDRQLWLSPGSLIEWRPSGATAYAPIRSVLKVLVQDTLDRVWIATTHRGLLCLDRGKFQKPQSPLLGPDDSILTALKDRHGALWFGVEDRGLLRWTDRRVQTLTRLDGLPHDDTFAVVPKNESTVWIGTQAGLARMTRNPTPHPARPKTDRPAVQPGSTASSATQTRSEPRVRRSSFKWTVDRDLPPLPGRLAIPTIRALHLDRQSRLWLDTELDLARVAPHALHSFDPHVRPAEVSPFHEPASYS